MSTENDHSTKVDEGQYLNFTLSFSDRIFTIPTLFGSAPWYTYLKHDTNLMIQFYFISACQNHLIVNVTASYSVTKFGVCFLICMNNNFNLNSRLSLSVEAYIQVSKNICETTKMRITPIGIKFEQNIHVYWYFDFY